MPPTSMLPNTIENWFSDMDIREESADAFPKMKFRSGVRACTLCESPGPYPSVEVDTEPSCSRNIDSSPEKFCINSNGYLQVTPKTRKIKTLLSNVSKLKKRLYENSSASRLLGQLQAKLADKPYLYQFIHSQIRMIQCRSSKGRRWSAKEKSFALRIYLHSPSAYRILRKYFAFPHKQSNLTQVIGYYFTSPTDKFSLKGLVEEAIDVLQSCQLEVASIVCDQSPKNKGLFKELKGTTEKPYFIHKAKKIYAMVDPPFEIRIFCMQKVDKETYNSVWTKKDECKTCSSEESEQDIDDLALVNLKNDQDDILNSTDFKRTQDSFIAVDSQNVQDGASFSSISENVLSYISDRGFFNDKLDCLAEMADDIMAVTSDTGAIREVCIEPFHWPFVTAAVSQPIIGANFLLHFGLLVGIRQGCLIDPLTKLQSRGTVQSGKGADIKTITGDTQFQRLLSEFSALTETHSTIQAKHDIKHFIQTTGPPVFPRPRRVKGR
ncbi:unnamed protein product [Larinioides sclopetarius]|uniref:Transposable element P transposase-like RNase H domain-containing protein n=1 Tax=Larinioides sclopetarius TaxID=280406 RepID=A0AAV1ZQP1_9ARAC